MDPLLIDIPAQLMSDRLILRAPRAGDGPVINEAIVESIEELRPWMPWATPTPSVEESEAHSRKAAAKFLAREDLQVRLELKNSGVIVGGSGLHRIEWKIPKFEIGYWIRTKFVGQGYASETVRTLAAFAFEHLKAERVEIRCDVLNERSWRVAERCGFQLEGVLRNDSRDTAGEIRSTRVYAKIADD